MTPKDPDSRTPYGGWEDVPSGAPALPTRDRLSNLLRNLSARVIVRPKTHEAARTPPVLPPPPDLGPPDATSVASLTIGAAGITASLGFWTWAFTAPIPGFIFMLLLVCSIGGTALVFGVSAKRRRHQTASTMRVAGYGMTLGAIAIVLNLALFLLAAYLAILVGV
jgi:hypothetical protein